MFNNRFTSIQLINERKPTMKKTFVSTVIALLLLIVLASTTFAAPSATEKLLTGSFDATETHEFGPGIMFVDATGVGNATHLGLQVVSKQAQLSRIAHASRVHKHNSWAEFVSFRCFEVAFE